MREKCRSPPTPYIVALLAGSGSVLESSSFQIVSRSNANLEEKHNKYFVVCLAVSCAQYRSQVG
jgi:hypothetical protein